MQLALLLSPKRLQTVLQELTVIIQILILDGDSIYLPLSKYYTTPGMKQTVVLPFADFAQLASGKGVYDFLHLKDWTFVDPKPLGQPFVFSNMILLGGAPGCNGTLVGNGTLPGNGTVVGNGTLTGNGTLAGNGTIGNTENNSSKNGSTVPTAAASNDAYVSFSLGILIISMFSIFD